MRSVFALVLFVFTAPTAVAQPRSEQVDPSALAAAAARLGRVIWSPMATLDRIGVDPFVLRPPVAAECPDRTVYCPPVYRSDFVLGGVAGADVWIRVEDAGPTQTGADVSGANSFFHLRPSDAERIGIPDEFLVPSIRNSRYLAGAVIDDADVGRWIARDEPVFLLRIPPRAEVPGAVRAYLDTDEGRRARTAYKCRNRTPWYTVPDVRRPEFVLTYMSGKSPALAVNRGRCTCTNALLAVDLRSGLFDGDAVLSGDRLSTAWSSAAGRLSCELEGHPLGGGMLKLEPGEAQNVLLIPDQEIGRSEGSLLEDGVDLMRQWRHVGGSSRFNGTGAADLEDCEPRKT